MHLSVQKYETWHKLSFSSWWCLLESNGSLSFKLKSMPLSECSLLYSYSDRAVHCDTEQKQGECAKTSLCPGGTLDLSRHLET